MHLVYSSSRRISGSISNNLCTSVHRCCVSVSISLSLVDGGGVFRYFAISTVIIITARYCAFRDVLSVTVVVHVLIDDILIYRYRINSFSVVGGISDFNAAINRTLRNINSVVLSVGVLVNVGG